MCRERQDRVGLLAANMQSLATGGNNANLRRALQQRIGKACASTDQMFAVVDDKQQLVVLDVLTERLRKWFSLLFADAQYLRGGVWNQRWILDGGQVDEPDSIRIFFKHIGADLQRQARLAEPAHAQEGQQPRATEQLLDFGEFTLTSDE